MISITIITVVKNNSEEILKTLSSINNQTYDNFEHIIIDSNSTDGTSEIIDRFNFKIKTIYLRENDNGIYQALNKGIRKPEVNLLEYYIVEMFFFVMTH